MVSYIMYFILLVFIVILFIFIYRFINKLIWISRLKKRQEALGEVNITIKTLSFRMVPVLIMIITTVLFVSNGKSIAINIFPSPMGICICAPDDYQCILNSNDDISIITVDKFYEKIEYNPFNLNSYQYYDSIFFEFSTNETLAGEAPISNIIGQWIPANPNNSVGCETKIELEEGKTYLIIGGNLSENDIDSFTNSFQHIPEDHYWVGFIIELEDYDSSKPLNQQSQDVQDEVSNYIDMLD